jgi:hypothetical protein
MALNNKTQATLDHAHEIAQEYDGNLTVRQLYYQLVARGFIPNSQESYKRIVSILTDARLAGDFPFEWLVDRTREARGGKFTMNDVDVDEALVKTGDSLKNAPYWWIGRDRWFGQRTHVSVWVEKEALMGVFEKPCNDLGVAWFVLRGYSSLSALSQWLDNLQAAYQCEDECGDSTVPYDEDRTEFDEAVVLYFGDHDPDGWEIPRSAERNLEAITNVRGLNLPPIRFERVALNREQIDRYNPPPFPAKETSARFNGYVDEHGLTDAWELDALRPDVLDKLIRDAVNDLYDEDVAKANLRLVQERREELKARIREPGWVAGVLK